MLVSQRPITTRAAIGNAMLSMTLVLLPACGGGGGSSGSPVVPTPPSAPITPIGPAVSTIYTFGSQPSDGVQPYGALLQASDGNFYGTTAAGGANSCSAQPNFCGTVYRLTPGGVATVLHSFDDSPRDGWKPVAALIQGRDGSLYGTTANGGEHGAGTVFKLTLNGVYTVLYSFGSYTGDGATPGGALLQATDGNFYGTTVSGGANSCFGVPNSCGTLFKLTPSGVETLLYSFGASSADGALPQGALVQAADGNIYGTTTAGGANPCRGYTYQCGTVFKLTPAGVLTVLHTFGAELADGLAPQGALIQANDGNFYGTTASGGERSCNSLSGCGTVFKMTPDGSVTTLYAFAATTSDGSGPAPTLIQARDGNLYGTTRGGGAKGNGTVFRLTTAGARTILHSFDSSVLGGAGDPDGGVIQASDGNLYGVTFYSGSPTGGLSSGTVFKVVL